MLRIRGSVADGPSVDSLHPSAQSEMVRASERAFRVISIYSQIFTRTGRMTQRSSDSHRTNRVFIVVSDPQRSNQSMPSLTRSNFSE